MRPSARFQLRQQQSLAEIFIYERTRLMLVQLLNMQVLPCVFTQILLEPRTHLALIGWGRRSRLCFGGFCIWLLFFCCHGSEAGKWDLWCLKRRMNVLLQKAALATDRTALKCNLEEKQNILISCQKDSQQPEKKRVPNCRKPGWKNII